MTRDPKRTPLSNLYELRKPYTYFFIIVHAWPGLQASVQGGSRSNRLCKNIAETEAMSGALFLLSGLSAIVRNRITLASGVPEKPRPLQLFVPPFLEAKGSSLPFLAAGTFASLLQHFRPHRKDSLEIWRSVCVACRVWWGFRAVGRFSGMFTCSQSD